MVGNLNYINIYENIVTFVYILSSFKGKITLIAKINIHYCQFVCSHEFADYFRRIRIFHSQSSSMNSANERIRMRKFSGSHTNWFIPTFHMLTKIFACKNLV